MYSCNRYLGFVRCRHINTILDPFVTFLCGYIVGILCAVTTICSYSKIFFTLRRRNQVDVQMEHSHGHPIQAIPRNVALYKKAVYSALWVQVRSDK